MAGADPETHDRRSVRLPAYDYAEEGFYFVTVCTRDRTCWLGRVEDRMVTLNKSGHIVQRVWDALPRRLPTIAMDAFVIMPNHIHGIIQIHGNPGVTDAVDRANVGAQFIAPSQPATRAPSEYRGSRPGSGGHPPVVPKWDRAWREGAMNCAPTLGEIVRSLKAVSTRLVRTGGNRAFSWQRDYYEHVIRSEQSLTRIREYIANNPARWEEDQLHPSRPSRW